MEPNKKASSKKRSQDEFIRSNPDVKELMEVGQMEKKFKEMNKEELTATDLNLIELLMLKCKLDEV